MKDIVLRFSKHWMRTVHHIVCTVRWGVRFLFNGREAGKCFLEKSSPPVGSINRVAYCSSQTIVQCLYVNPDHC